MGKITREKFKTEKTVFDNHTIKNIQKLESEGFFDFESLIPLFMGKESNVFIGNGKHGDVIVKIYRLENCDFNQMFQYMKEDPRYHKISRKRRDVIFAWAKREYKNLLRCREFKVKVPNVYTVKDNILVMEMIGNPASKLKDDVPENINKFYKDLVKEIKKMLKSGIVHGDLSKFNILNLKDKPVLIDMSQSMPRNSRRAREYFERDMTNVNNFFRKKGVEEKELKTFQDFVVKKEEENKN